jgi:hypothetical protein
MTKLSDKCACGSGKLYRSCCLRLETAYLVIGAFAGLALFGAHHEGPIVVVSIFLVAGVLGLLAKKFLGSKK